MTSMMRIIVVFAALLLSQFSSEAIEGDHEIEMAVGQEEGACKDGGDCSGDGVNHTWKSEEEHNEDENERKDEDVECPAFELKDTDLREYLNPRITAETIEEIGRRLRDGKLVIIRNAFLPQFAEAMHCDLNRQTAWALHENYDEEFHYSHHNIYKVEDCSDMMKFGQALFDSDETKRFMTELSGRDCMGDQRGTEGSASYYMPGDHSLPHTDHGDQRTVAYVWHLSKNWRPEWGGSLVWHKEHSQPYFAASFNTLVLFSVHHDTSHFVSQVSPHATTEKRLAFNGWFQADWLPSLDQNLEEVLGTTEQRYDLTTDQVDAFGDIVDNELDDIDPERREALKAIWDDLEEEWYPDEYETVYELDL